MATKIGNLARLFGIDGAKTIRSAVALPRFASEYRDLKSQMDVEGAIQIGRFYPVLNERDDPSGSASGHYFHQDLLVAQKVFASAAERVIDVGSRVDGFVAHVASFRPIEVVDIRRLESVHDNIRFLQCDMMDGTALEKLGQCDLVTCLHVLEHFGLGRYGDPIAADGHVTGLRNLERLVAPGGRLILSVPIGRERVEFNAHRVFSSQTLPKLLAERFALTDFSYVDDDGDLHQEIDLDTAAPELNRLHFGCGIYDFRRMV